MLCYLLLVFLTVIAKSLESAYEINEILKSRTRSWASRTLGGFSMAQDHTIALADPDGIRIYKCENDSNWIFQQLVPNNLTLSDQIDSGESFQQTYPLAINHDRLVVGDRCSENQVSCLHVYEASVLHQYHYASTLLAADETEFGSKFALSTRFFMTNILLVSPSDEDPHRLPDQTYKLQKGGVIIYRLEQNKLIQDVNLNVISSTSSFIATEFAEYGLSVAIYEFEYKTLNSESWRKSEQGESKKVEKESLKGLDALKEVRTYESSASEKHSIIYNHISPNLLLTR